MSIPIWKGKQEEERFRTVTEKRHYMNCIRHTILQQLFVEYFSHTSLCCTFLKSSSYRATMGVSGSFASGGPSFLNVRTPVKMPDSIRGEKYAFVALPLAEMLPGGSITSENIGVGRMCPIPENIGGGLSPADTFVQGIVILTQRPDALAAWLAGTELASMSCDLRKRDLIMETDIDTRYLMAKLNDQQREEGVAFEEGKDALDGLHFVCVQRDEDDEPAGFWLMRTLPEGI